VKRVNLSLHCEFSDEELQAKAQGLSQATIELREVEEEKAAVSKEFTDQIKEIRSRMSGLAKAYKARGETRLVECVVRMNDPAPLQKTTVRLDTGEVVKVEPMTEEERQEKLFEEKQEERELVDSTVERVLRDSAIEEEIEEVPPHEDATFGEYEPNEDESEGSGE
jgi:hypothetical protein